MFSSMHPSIIPFCHLVRLNLSSSPCAPQSSSPSVLSSSSNSSKSSPMNRFSSTGTASPSSPPPSSPPPSAPERPFSSPPPQAPFSCSSVSSRRKEHLRQKSKRFHSVNQ
ncbi:hypothetical protein CHARACLAT_013024 [Characodon lateralis]|uniref:Uncharacterized protein n=1 Tax=Characodon lateralis TaxID=208331 RepID=A0ABU7EUU4_9TELE|nr:hypothetical protein [Characodon lateralis]